MIKITFWVSLGITFYTYCGYPLFLYALSRLRKASPCGVAPSSSVHRRLSVVIAARNEEGKIRRRIDNLLAQDCAPDLEIIVVSDGSSDRTAAAAADSSSRVRVIELPRVVGKAVAVNAGVAAATGEIIVFADARQTFAPDAISRLVEPFSDPAVGCVSGELLFSADGESSIAVEMGGYWKYEKRIRRMESATGSVVGATGAIYAIRRSLYRPLPAGTILDDVLTPLTIVRQGYRCIFEGSAIAWDAVSRDVAGEWRRKVRTLSGNWQLLSLSPSLLLPWRNPCWWRFLSHKIFRLLVPFSLAAMFVASLLLPQWQYRLAAGAQLLFLAAVAAGLAIPVERRPRILNIGWFFLVMNAAAAVAFWRWASGRSARTWAMEGNHAPR